jgi:hypothetical protein
MRRWEVVGRKKRWLCLVVKRDLWKRKFGMTARLRVGRL